MIPVRWDFEDSARDGEVCGSGKFEESQDPGCVRLPCCEEFMIILASVGPDF